MTRTEKLANLADKDLLHRFVRHKNERAFAVLVERHGPMVRGACWRILQHTQDTEDAFQAAFLVLARKARSIQKHQSIASWLYKVAYRIALRARAKRSLRQARENRLAVQVSEAPNERRQSEIESLVDDEVQRLPEKYRTPVLMCYLQGRTNEEAARQLRCPTGTVKIRLLRGREMLKKRLLRQGVGLSLAVWLSSAVQQAQAEVPDALLQSTVDAASEVAGGAKLANLGLSQSAVRLAQSWFQRIAVVKAKVAAVVLLTVLLLVLTDRMAQKAFSAPLVQPETPVPFRTIPSPSQPEFQAPSSPSSGSVDFLAQEPHNSSRTKTHPF